MPFRQTNGNTIPIFVHFRVHPRAANSKIADDHAADTLQKSSPAWISTDPVTSSCHPFLARNLAATVFLFFLGAKRSIPAARKKMRIKQHLTRFTSYGGAPCHARR
jgi:hypothetical protein